MKRNAAAQRGLRPITHNFKDKTSASAAQPTPIHEINQSIQINSINKLIFFNFHSIDFIGFAVEELKWLINLISLGLPRSGAAWWAVQFDCFHCRVCFIHQTHPSFDSFQQFASFRNLHFSLFLPFNLTHQPLFEEFDGSLGLFDLNLIDFFFLFASSLRSMGRCSAHNRASNQPKEEKSIKSIKHQSNETARSLTHSFVWGPNARSKSN